MAATASPYGLVPVKNADGSAYNGARDAFFWVYSLVVSTLTLKGN
jgi:hypothetical protein